MFSFVFQKATFVQKLRDVLLASLKVSDRAHVLWFMHTITSTNNARDKSREKGKKNTARVDIILIRHSDTLLVISLFNKTVHFVHFLTKSNKVLLSHPYV